MVQKLVHMKFNFHVFCTNDVQFVLMLVFSRCKDKQWCNLWFQVTFCE